MTEMHLFDPGPETADRAVRVRGAGPAAVAAHARALCRRDGGSAGRQLTAERRALIEADYHPLTRLPLAGNGQTCGTCGHAYRSGRYVKCGKHRDTASPTTDVVQRWPACQLWTETS